MRDILFRAKAKQNNEWVYGDYLSTITRTGGKNHYIKRAEDGLLTPVEVIPETLGQITGLFDSNGKIIFEGDILSEKPPMNTTAYIGYVAYDNDAAAYRFKINNDGKYNDVLLGSYSRSYTKIGNIHDNPEMLGGAE